MKKLLIAGVLLVAIIGGVLGYLVFNINSFAQRYKPDLEKAASEALGSTVTFGEVSARILPTARIVIDDTNVENEGESLTLANLTLDIALMPLFSSELYVRELSLREPRITVYLEEDGARIAGIPNAPADESGAEEDEPAPEGGASSTDLPITVTLNNVALRDATIAVIDRVNEEEYVIKDLTVEAALGFANNIVTLTSLDGGMTLLEEIEVAFSGRDANVDLSGGTLKLTEAKAKALGNTFTLAGGINPGNPEESMRLSSDGVKLGSLKPLYDVFAPGLNELGIEGTARPDLTFGFDEQGSYEADGAIALADARWIVSDIPVSEVAGTLNARIVPERMTFGTEGLTGKLRDAPFKIKVASSVKDQQAGLETLTAEIFDGVANLETTLDLAGDMPFSTKLDMKGLQLEQVVATLLEDTPLNVTGTLQTVTGDVQGTLSDDLMPSITGTASMLLNDGLIKDVNLGKLALARVDNVPIVGGALLAMVPPGMQQFIEKDRTLLESVSGSFDIANETLSTEDLVIESDYFRLESVGDIGFDSNLDLDAVIYFSRPFTEGLVGQRKEVGFMVNDDGLLAFPVKVTGIPPDLRVVPDVKELFRRMTQGAARNAAGEVIGGVLGGDEQDSEGGNIVDRLLPRRESESTEEESTEDTAGGLLDRVLPKEEDTEKEEEGGRSLLDRVRRRIP